jgi:hypothetical protein
MSNTRILELSNGSNWLLKADTVLYADWLDGSRNYFGHRPYPVATTFENSIAAFWVESENAKPYWTNGGYVRQTISTPLVSGSSFDSVIQKRYKILHKTVTIQFFPAYITEYGLIIDIPYYMNSVQLSVWEYVGTDIDLIYQDTQEILERI